MTSGLTTGVVAEFDRRCYGVAASTGVHCRLHSERLDTALAQLVARVLTFSL